MIRVFFFLIGFGLSTIGFCFIILYLNLLTIGYNFFDYVNFIIKRPECILGIIGFAIMSISIISRGEDKNELYI